MSASLVGSEMCIRDRRSGHSVADPPVPPELRQWANPASAIDSPCGAGSVSYTHLTLPTICSV
eukprot:7752028-Alexandrium_andersonii.AAC.1